jgi:hypothetical protein
VAGGTVAANDDTWEARIERARGLRDAVAAGGGLSELGDEERDILTEALDGWLALDERHLAEVRRKLPPGDEPVAAVPGLPPAPWHWERVTPEPSRLDPQPEPRGVALVAADGTWVVSADGGYGTPEIGGDTRIDPDHPSLIAGMLASAGELWEDLDDAVLEAWDVATAHGQVGPIPETARDIVVLLRELIDTLAADTRLLAAETKRLWGLAGPDATVTGEVAEALDRHWRAQTVFRPAKTGPVGPTPDETEALRRQITDRYRDEDP